MVDEEFLAFKDVAERLGVGVRIVYRLAGSGELGCYKVGGQYRVSTTDLEAYRERVRRPARAECECACVGAG